MTAKGCNAENELRRNSAGFKWVQAALCHDTARRLSLILGCSEPLAKILSARGWREPGEAEIFLDPKLAHLGDPLKLPGIRDAADALIEAAAQRRRITLFSDYDVDGITSSALLERLLRVLGARPELFLPERLSEGYGLSAAAAERCLRETRPELLVVLDCGTNSRAEIEKIRAGGVRVIVLDHHEPGDVASPEVLINPKCRDGGRGHVNLCTVGLVFKLCHGLLKLEPKLQETFSLKRHLDFVALGTVADLVPLLGENRILARHGLEQMANTAHPGIRALLSVAGVTERPSTEDCGFRLGPRLNAAGRLESAKAALELLVTEDAERARKLAEQLDEVNRERRQVQEAMSAEAIGLAQARLQAGDRVLVLAREGWHQGVAGIVAAKVSQKFHRPAFVFAIDPATRVAKGSGRSISGFPLME
ncbi:MAG: DHH family phosphoesterase, partial [Verrucomicrobiae bacterium]|nr:DHH family phosphoesterase [Verrucomicrobiae bacterium]